MMPFTRSGQSIRAIASRHSRAVAALPRGARIGRLLPFAPDPQDAGMLQIDAALAVQAVEAFHHVVRLAGALTRPAPETMRAPSRRAVSAAMVQNQASSALRKASVRLRGGGRGRRGGGGWSRAVVIGGIFLSPDVNISGTYPRDRWRTQA